jgi:hypothetical protein
MAVRKAIKGEATVYAMYFHQSERDAVREADLLVGVLREHLDGKPFVFVGSEECRKPQNRRTRHY